jgi:hypothetical protein
MGWREKAKMGARKKAYDYIETNGIVKPPCQMCGFPVTHMHHPSYDEPYKVVFVCRGCHWGIHKNQIICPEPIDILTLPVYKRPADAKAEFPESEISEFVNALFDCKNPYTRLNSSENMSEFSWSKKQRFKNQLVKMGAIEVKQGKIAALWPKEKVIDYIKTHDIAI